MKLGTEYDITNYSTLIISIILALTILNVLAVLFFRKAVENSSAKYELDLIKSRNELEEERYKEIGNLYSQLQITRHDIRDHLVYINCLLENGDYEAVNKYISDTQAELDNTKHFCHTGNRMVDYIIGSNLAQHSEIFFIITGTLGNMDKIEEADLCSLLGNMLSNATRGVEGSNPKQITIEFSTHGVYQNIICKNTIPRSVLKYNPELKTSKKDKAGHGYGVKSMQRIIEKYDGIIQFYEENSMFCVHAALPAKDIDEL